MQIDVRRVSIIEVEADAIVNAANRSLLGGGGVDGVIHRAAGPGLLEECRPLNGCETGQVKMTGAHNLPYKAIIHAVGPIWRGGNEKEEQLLGACYENALNAAHEAGFSSIAFPAISTGVYCFPLDLASKIAVETCAAWQENEALRVVLTAIDRKTEAALSRALDRFVAGRA